MSRETLDQLRLEAKVTPGGVREVRVSGAIDGRAQLGALLESAQVLRIDLAGVTRIDSLGVREWIRVTAAIPEATEVVWVATGVPMATQLTMISHFADRARIESIHVPCRCTRCGLEHRTTCTDLGQAEHDVKLSACNICGAPLDLDDDDRAFVTSVMEALDAR